MTFLNLIVISLHDVHNIITPSFLEVLVYMTLEKMQRQIFYIMINILAGFFFIAWTELIFSNEFNILKNIYSIDQSQRSRAYNIEKEKNVIMVIYILYINSCVFDNSVLLLRKYYIWQA